MKIAILTFLFVALIATGLVAQKGSILVAGDFSFQSAKQNNYSTYVDVVKRSVFLASPVVGYQFNKNWTAGVAMSIGSGKVEGTPYPQTTMYISSAKENIFMIGPMIRYTQKISNTFNFYTQLQGTFGNDKFISSSTNPSATTDEYKSKLTNIALTPAIFINIINNFGFNISIGGFTYQEIEYDDAKMSYSGIANTKRSGFEFTLGKTINIGISKNFGGKK